MARISFLPKSQQARRRQRLLFRALFLVLLLHAVLVYTVSEFTMLTRGSVAWLIQGAPGALDSVPKLITKERGRTYLWGGQEEHERFDITEFQLDPGRLNWGLGREYFTGSTEPEFDTVVVADDSLDDSQPVLVVKIADQTKVYPVRVLRARELINDTIGDRPIFVAYCPLAELGAAYDRRIDGRVHTFAPSGYTYNDPRFWDGREAFVLWDRETESLWWPPIGKAVSGPLNETAMTVLEQELWAQTTWGVVKRDYPEAMVLRPIAAPPQAGDTQEDAQMEMQASAYPAGPKLMRPTGSRPHLDAADDKSIAPRWGRNASLGSTTKK